jgi:hypothetical protein
VNVLALMRANALLLVEVVRVINQDGTAVLLV